MLFFFLLLFCLFYWMGMWIVRRCKVGSSWANERKWSRSSHRMSFECERKRALMKESASEKAFVLREWDKQKERVSWFSVKGIVATSRWFYFVQFVCVLACNIRRRHDILQQNTTEKDKTQKLHTFTTTVVVVADATVVDTNNDIALPLHWLLCTHLIWLLACTRTLSLSCTHNEANVFRLCSQKRNEQTTEFLFVWNFVSIN